MRRIVVLALVASLLPLPALAAKKPPAGFWEGMGSFWWLVIGAIVLVESARKLGWLKDPSSVETAKDIADLSDKLDSISLNVSKLCVAHQVGEGERDRTKKGTPDPDWWCRVSLDVTPMLIELKEEIRIIESRLKDSSEISIEQMERVIAILETIANYWKETPP